MHTHVIPTTLAKLADKMDYWLAADDDYDVVSTGGRDVALVVRHAHTGTDHSDGAADPVPGWFVEVWDALTTRRPIDFQQHDVPKGVADFLGNRFLDTALGTGAGGPRLVRVQEYGPSTQHLATEDPPPDMAAGLVEDTRRTWVLWYGQDGRPTALWLRRGADGEVLGEPVELETPAREHPARHVTVRRQASGWDRFAFTDDDGLLVGAFTVDPRDVTLIHDRGTPPEWIGAVSS